MRNTQRPSKQSDADGVLAPLMVREIFHSIQGEGPFAGHPATFFRLGYCNLQCTWCDTDYTNNLYPMNVEDLLKQAHSHLIVITGGEPFIHQISPLVRALLRNGHRVQIETNGNLSQPGLPWEDPELVVVCSPKAGRLHPDIVNYCRHFKYVVSVDDKDSEDGLPVSCTQPKGSQPPANPPSHRTVYLMPRDDEDVIKNQANMMTAAHLTIKFGYILTMQLHKILGVR